MKYLTAKETAEKWNMSLRQVQHFCSSGKIPGVTRTGHQWMIPFDAKRPMDRRFLAAKNAASPSLYHFPVLIYSEYYSSPEELSEDELRLLDAQILNLQNRFTESVIICRELISQSSSPSVQFGAYFTNASNYQILGLASEIPFCIEAMKKICQKDTEHQEDYRLCIAYSMYFGNFDVKPFLNIDVTKLSREALITYRILSINAYFFSGEPNSNALLSTFKAICYEIGLLDIAPAYVIFCGSLATLCSRQGDYEAEKRYIKEVCRTGYEKGLDRLLARTFAIIDKGLYRECLSEYGCAFAQKIEKISIANAEKWKISTLIAFGQKRNFEATHLECEVVMLLMSKTKISDIAMLKNISQNEVRDIVKRLCTRFSLQSKDELIDYFKELFYRISDSTQPQ